MEYFSLLFVPKVPFTMNEGLKEFHYVKVATLQDVAGIKDCLFVKVSECAGDP